MIMANYRPYQFIKVPTNVIPVPNCTYPHPFVIYEVSGVSMYALMVSTKIQTFYDENFDFLMEETEDGFTTTGLTDNSFAKVLDFRIATSIQLPIIGELSGDLLDRFKNYAKRHDF